MAVRHIDDFIFKSHVKILNEMTANFTVSLLLLLLRMLLLRMLLRMLLLLLLLRMLLLLRVLWLASTSITTHSGGS